MLIIFFVSGYNEAKTPANMIFASSQDEIELIIQVSLNGVLSDFKNFI